MNTENISGEIFYIINFDSGWISDGEYWPEPCAAMFSNGKILSPDDFVFYNSTLRTHREIRGGGITVPCSANHSIIGPICGDDDGDMEGRMLRASGMHDFLFFLMDLSKMDSNVDEIQLLLFDYYKLISLKSKLHGLKNRLHERFYKKRSPYSIRHYSNIIMSQCEIPPFKDREGFLNALIVGKKHYTSPSNILIESSPFEFLNICEHMGSFYRMDENNWTYKPFWNRIDSLEEYLNQHVL